MDDEIVQDFLIEGGETLEQLDAQLVALESAPDDKSLLNAVFRAFHTIKGGAGFLGLEHLVAISHKSEDIFDMLRKGALPIDATLMDTFLEVLDVLRLMFEQLRTGLAPAPAPSPLLARLQAISDGTVTPLASVKAVVVADMPTPVGDLISDDEFEALLDNLHGGGKFLPAVLPPAAAAPMATQQPLPAKRVTRAAEPAKDTTVRVETATLDRIMNMVGELVLIRNRLLNLEAAVGNEAITQTVANLDVVTSDLQMAAMKTRMQPIKKVFGRFPRVVRDLARALDKQIELVMEGEDTDLDKNLVETLADPLIHLVRNSVDHGIEMPAERLAAGKPATGVLRLAAAQGGDQIVLTIADDGKGIDAEALRRKVVEKGLMDEEAAARLSTRECYELIFLPGFSTKDQISDISGRGVGMDVVKTRITQINGSIQIDSQLGVGTIIRISVPLTLAIMPTLMVVLGTQVFALPLVNVQEIINFERHQAREVDGRKTMVVRGKALPLFYLSRWLIEGVREFTEQQGHVVVVRIGNQSVGLLVDDLIGQEEVVIKPLGALLHGIKGLSGATITGNGKIALILDLPGLLESYARR